MSKNSVVVRTPQDLERKYNFASLLGLKKNVEMTAQGMQKIENELSNMLNALVINLKDVLDSQSEISLWFYSGIPTTTNEPYVSWGNPNDHLGDIYYDQSSGKVYQWNGLWEVNTYPDLIEAMAITDAETDTTKDHERKVFFDTPTTPYSNGDWWIKEDGRLFICQISKTEGIFEEADFINSNAYTESVAEKVAEELKVLKGTVTTITENYAKFTDLATGGSTTIAGENITTGNIQSQNYINSVSGTKINLSDGKIDSKNFKTDEEGNVTLGSGTKENPSFRILGENGTNLILTDTLASIIGNGGSVSISSDTNNGSLAGIAINTNKSIIQLLSNDNFVMTNFSYGDNYISSYIDDNGASLKVGNSATGEEVEITPKGKDSTNASEYSTIEQKIGTWIDGKPIYRKVISFTTGSSASDLDIPHGISNFEHIVNAYGFTHRTSDNECRLIPNFYRDSNNSLYALVIYYITKTYITLSYGSQRTNMSGYIILEYTKTTD